MFCREQHKIGELHSRAYISGIYYREQQNTRGPRLRTTKNSHFGPKHNYFGPKFGFLLTLTTYLEVWGHVIAQNAALDKTKKLGYRKFF